MTRIEEIKTKPELNKYMTEVFNYHLRRVIDGNYVENIASEFKSMVNKDIEYRKNGFNNPIHKDIFKDVDVNELEGIKGTREILKEFKNKDNRYLKEIERELEETSDFIMNNKNLRIDRKFKNYEDLSPITKDAIHNADIIDIIPFNYGLKDAYETLKNVFVTFSPDNQITFNCQFSRIYGEEKIKKSKYNFRSRGGDFEDRNDIVILKNILSIPSTNSPAVLDYDFDINNIYYNLSPYSKRTLSELTVLMSSIIFYQKNIKNPNFKSLDVIELIKNNSRIRKLQLDYETNNENKYEIEPVPKHLKKLFGKGE
ncbi:hypothetical protein [Staphylococcus phage vB_StaM_SA1]|nr:hypothetical protein [Staphylococcus phage vB_StaM_SA1]